MYEMIKRNFKKALMKQLVPVDSGFCIMSEIWKDIHGYEGYYQVSNFGNVRSLPRECVRSDNYIKVFKGRLLKLAKDQLNYMHVVLSKHGKHQTVKIHRLVAIAFLENTENKRTVNHIDGNPSNNNVENLEWATHGENNAHAYRTGLKKIRLGEQVWNSKLKAADIKVIREMLKNGIMQKRIAQKYNVYRSTIKNIDIGKTWSHVS